MRKVVRSRAVVIGRAARPGPAKRQAPRPPRGFGERQDLRGHAAGRSRDRPNPSPSPLPARSYDEPIVMGDTDAIGWVLAVDADMESAEALGRLVIERSPHVRYVAVPTGERALEIMAQRCLLGAIVEVGPPGTSGFEIVKHIKARVGRPVPTTVLTAYPNQANAAALARVGFVIKDKDGSDTDCLRQFLADASVPRWSRLVAAVQQTRVTLNPRPLQVLLLNGAGAKRSDILAELRIDEPTMVSHVAKLLQWSRAVGLEVRLLADVVHVLSAPVGGQLPSRDSWLRP